MNSECSCGGEGAKKGLLLYDTGPDSSPKEHEARLPCLP